MNRVVVTGLGIVSPVGVGIQHAWTNLLAGRCGVTRLPAIFDKLPSRVGGLVPSGYKDDGCWRWEDWGKPEEQRDMPRFTQFAVAAAQEALHDAGYTSSTTWDRDNMGVCIGSGIGSLDDAYETSLAYDKGGYHHVPPRFVPRLLINMAAAHVAMRHGLRGPLLSPTSACTTGAHAVGDAARLVATGACPAVLAGASESCIHPLAIAGFARARSLATKYNDEPAAASRPFDKHRDGFVIGEGAGVMLLEELGAARRRGARIYAEVKGVGLSGDAFHMTAPPGDGAGAVLAMRRAMELGLGSGAGMGKREGEEDGGMMVDYVNAHATGTRVGDVAELRAIEVVMGERSGEGRERRETSVLVSATKGATGHLLGAAGAVEAVFTVLALKDGRVPPTLNADELDVGADGGGDAEARASVIVARAAGHDGTGERSDGTSVNVLRTDDPKGLPAKDMRLALTNSFGFGGTNCSLCFEKWTE